ncbi:glycosyltransferase family 2 protein [Geomonas sp.]|uniref:glycosyltransferase family 2 protein n=1 Tax=Geomonas sp. TaxID=2651584 RepID=UPI002B46D6E5|nr:glycosyltransferase family 2 protein [Geomonas sp.]HJV34180.1 glycosyltransferase family 2 protein [Geomonas sp.]
MTDSQKRSRPGLPLVSVVTVVFNGERHLEQTILSVLNQSYPNVEYVVIDGGSTDGTPAILERYAERIDCLVSERDDGIYDAMNKGIALAHGELIALLNADDYYEPDAIEQVAEAYLESPCQGVYYGNNYVLQEDLELKYSFYPSLARCWLGMPVCHQAMFVHRQVYQEVGGYSLGYRFAADYDFLLRSMRRQVPYLPVDAFLVNYRNTGLTSTNYAASLREAKRINGDHFGTLSLPHAKYLAGYYKTLTLFWLQKAIKALLGEKLLDRLRLWYLKLFIAKERHGSGPGER